MIFTINIYLSYILFITVRSTDYSEQNERFSKKITFELASEDRFKQCCASNDAKRKFYEQGEQLATAMRDQMRAFYFLTNYIVKELLYIARSGSSATPCFKNPSYTIRDVIERNFGAYFIMSLKNRLDFVENLLKNSTSSSKDGYLKLTISFSDLLFSFNFIRALQTIILRILYVYNGNTEPEEVTNAISTNKNTYQWCIEFFRLLDLIQESQFEDTTILLCEYNTYVDFAWLFVHNYEEFSQFINRNTNMVDELISLASNKDSTDNQFIKCANSRCNEQIPTDTQIIKKPQDQNNNTRHNNLQNNDDSNDKRRHTLNYTSNPLKTKQIIENRPREKDKANFWVWFFMILVCMCVMVVIILILIFVVPLLAFFKTIWLLLS